LTKLVFGWFFEIKLGNGLSHVQKRIEMYGKGCKRWKKVEIDGDFIGEYGFSCDVANAHGFLNCRFPYLGGVESWFGGCLVDRVRMNEE